MAYRLLLPLSCLALITACSAKEDDVPDGSSSGSASESASASETGATGPGATSDIEATMGPETGPETSTTSTTGPVQTTGAEVTSNGSQDSGDSETETEGDTEQVPEECLLPSQTYDAYITGPELVVDDTCIVTASQQVGDALELGFSCPVAGLVQLTVTGGPLPGVQVGEVLDVFYQQEHIPALEFPNMGLMFLRSGAQLRYGAATGFLFKAGQGESDADLERLTAGLAPLTFGVEMGPCPLVKNYEGDEPIGGDDWHCNFEALALARLAFGEEALLQGEGTSGVLAADADSYTLDVRFARRGTNCIDYALDRVAVAVALQSP